MKDRDLDRPSITSGKPPIRESSDRYSTEQPSRVPEKSGQGANEEKEPAHLPRLAAQLQNNNLNRARAGFLFVVGIPAVLIVFISLFSGASISEIASHLARDKDTGGPVNSNSAPPVMNPVDLWAERGMFLLVGILFVTAGIRFEAGPAFYSCLCLGVYAPLCLLAIGSEFIPPKPNPNPAVLSTLIVLVVLCESVIGTIRDERRNAIQELHSAREDR